MIVYLFSTIVSIFAAVPGATAESSVAVDLDLTGGISSKHSSNKKGGLNCKGGPGPTYRNDTVNVSAKLVYEINRTSVHQAGLKTDSEGAMVYALDVKTTIEEDAAKSKFSIGLSEVSRKKVERGWDSGCEHNHFAQYLQTAGYHGTITLKYRVPAGVWAVRIKTGPANDVFTRASRQPLTNVLLDPSVGAPERFVWTTPGSTLEQPLHIDVAANAARGPVDYALTVEPAGQRLTNDEAESILDQMTKMDVGSALLRDSLPADKAEIAALHLSQDMMSLIRSPEALTAGLRKLSVKKLDAVAKVSFSFANATFVRIDPDLATVLKTAGALLSYEVASLFTEEMSPYCEQRTVTLPLSGEKIEILGARYASFLLSKMSGRLSSNTVALHEKFLNELVNLKTRGYTYARVAKTEAIRTRLSKSFAVLRDATKPSYRPFAQARQDLIDFYRVFPPGGAGRDSVEGILQRMQALASKEDEYYVALFAHVDTYAETNTAVIDTAQLEKLMDELKIQLKDVVASLSAQGRFLTVDGDVGLNSLKATFLDLKAHNFNIVARAYEDVPFKFDFENVRKAYVNPERMNKNLSTIKACVYDGIK